jgi:hypothetical protein
MKRKGRVKLSVVVIEIEVPTEIDSFTKFEILDEYGRTYKSWIQQCYLHRMKEILANPTEFGKVVLEEMKRDHCSKLGFGELLDTKKKGG